jgi:hypothetical protein
MLVLGLRSCVRLVFQICHDLLRPGRWVLRMVRPTIIEIDDLLPLLLNRFRRELDVDRELCATRALPPRLTHPAGSDLKQSSRSGLGDFVRAQKKHSRSDVVGLESLHHLLGHDGAGHVRAGVGRDGVDVDVVLLAFSGKRPREAQDTALRRCIIRLAEVAVNAGSGSGVHNAAVLLLEHVRPCSLADFVGASQVHIQDLHELLVVHVGECLITQDACIVDDDVNAAVGIDGSFHDGVAIFGARLDTYSLATELLNLLHYVVRIHKIIDDNFRTIFGELQAVYPTKAGATTCHKRNLASIVNLLGRRIGRQLLCIFQQFHEVGWSGRVLRLGEIAHAIPLLEQGARCETVICSEERTL